MAAGGAGLLALAIALAGAAGCARPAVSVDYRGGYDFTRTERALIEDVANRAARDVRPLLPALRVDLRLTVDAGDRVIPETGENGSTGLPRTVYWIVNPSHPGGAPTPWGAYPADAQAWTAELLSQPPGASIREWMSKHPDGRRWVGYKVGTYIADRAVKESGRSLVQLAVEPTETIISWAKVR